MDAGEQRKRRDKRRKEGEARTPQPRASIGLAAATDAVHVLFASSVRELASGHSGTVIEALVGASSADAKQDLRLLSGLLRCSTLLATPTPAPCPSKKRAKAAEQDS
jgi:hypothetical protein